MKCSIIVPVLNEAPILGAALEALLPLREDGHEVIVVDGGSTDGSAARAQDLADVVLNSQRGRAVQMNCGAEAATGEVLLFLHADVRLPDDAPAYIAAALRGRPGWGRFDVRLSGTAPVFRLVERLMNLRSRRTGIATGDQAIFVHRDLFRSEGGYASIPLMEDVELCRRLRAVRAPLCLRQQVRVSTRRWERHGILRTILLMWLLRLRFALGADPAVLARHYA